MIINNAAKSRRDDPLLTVGFNLRSATLWSGIPRSATLRLPPVIAGSTRNPLKKQRMLKQVQHDVCGVCSSIPLGMHRSVERKHRHQILHSVRNASIELWNYGIVELLNYKNRNNLHFGKMAAVLSTQKSLDVIKLSHVSNSRHFRQIAT